MMAINWTKIGKLKTDLEKVVIPFDLYTGMALVTDELKGKGFSYDHMLTDQSTILVFKSEEEKATITVEKENLLIRQYNKDTGKLKVLYVLKPTQREFKLLITDNKK
jgi:hypothetical protein